MNKDSNSEEPRVLTFDETDIFLEAAQHYRYFNTFSLALETGMRIGELLGLKWSDIDFENRTIYVNRILVYVICKDETSPKYGKKIYEFVLLCDGGHAQLTFRKQMLNREKGMA